MNDVGGDKPYQTGPVVTGGMNAEDFVEPEAGSRQARQPRADIDGEEYFEKSPRNVL
ncbi:MAG TPA: hypothetical protein VJM12_14840 [Pyrinomonadaceae bacterium]|nr:hypothetical protein [Pyrinomonadaceae bacterium]